MLHYKLKVLMRERGVTYKQVSQEANVAVSTLQKVAKDEVVQTDVIDRLLTYFNCGLTDFVVYASAKIPSKGDMEMAPSSIKADIDSMINEAIGKQIRPQNQKALHLLSDWLSEPDELGPAWWDEFRQDLEENRLTFRELHA